MSAVIIDGKADAAETRARVRARVAELTAAGERPPCLAVILVGDDPASRVYVNNKKKACEACGIESRELLLPADTTQAELLRAIEALNGDPSADGILCQLPVPPQIDKMRVIASIDPEKDVDGFHPLNVGRMVARQPGFLPCTPAGIMALLEAAGVDPDGKRAVVIGRSNIVGKPVSVLLARANATVTVCHTHTRDLPDETRRADILIAAAGVPRMVTAEMVKPGAAVIDVGIHRLPEGGLCGDVAFETVKEVAGAITPVPGGVGPMTVAMLMKNALQARLNRAGL